MVVSKGLTVEGPPDVFCMLVVLIAYAFLGVNDWDTVIVVRVLRMVTDSKSFGCNASLLVVYRVRPCTVNNVQYSTCILF